MRHVSRTHRVALDWLFDRINLDPKIQIRYIDTKQQLRRHIDQRQLSHSDEWDNLLSFVQHQPFQFIFAALRISALTSCTKNNGEKDAGTERRKQDCGRVKADDDEPEQFCSCKFFICELSDCVG